MFRINVNISSFQMMKDINTRIKEWVKINKLIIRRMDKNDVPD